MLLTSSLEPGGPKSTHHYIILHHDNQRRLIKLPETYADLKKAVESVYHIDPDRFHVETKELNICGGERIKIPGDFWSDIAKLLGNVYVVPCSEDSHPESFPEPEIVSLPTPVQANSVVLNLEQPLMKGEVIVVHLGSLAFNADSTTPQPELEVQVLDEREDCALTVRTSPQSGFTTLATTTDEVNTTVSYENAFSNEAEHYLFIYKQKTRFMVLLDSHLLGAVGPAGYVPLTHIACSTLSPFKGPLSTNVYSNFKLLHDEFGPHHAVSLPYDKDTLFDLIVACDPRVPDVLAIMRKEISLFKYSGSGINWRARQLPFSQWTDSGWDPLPYSILVVRYTLTQGASKRLGIHFSPQGTNSSLDIDILLMRDADFWEYSDSGKFEKFHTVELRHPMHTVGDHSVALVNHGGQFHVFFDFKQSTVVPRTTLFRRKPNKMWTSIVDGCRVEADVYDFRS